MHETLQLKRLFMTRSSGCYGAVIMNERLVRSYARADISAQLLQLIFYRDFVAAKVAEQQACTMVTKPSS